MSNDELSAIDAAIAREQPLSLEQAKALREQLALVAAQAVRVRAELKASQLTQHCPICEHHARDRELLAQLRSHKDLTDLLYTIESTEESWDRFGEHGADSTGEAPRLLLQLLRGSDV